MESSDEAIDLSSEHDFLEVLTRFQGLDLLNHQDRADLAFSLLVSYTESERA